MLKNIVTIQKKIGLLITTVSFFAIIDNIIKEYMVSGGNIAYILTRATVWLLFLTTIPFILSIFIESKFLKIIQCVLILFTGFMSMMQSFDAVYGPGLVLTAWLLMRSYGYFDYYRKLKYTVFLLVVIILTQLSAFLNGNELLDSGLQMLEYSVFIVIFVIIIWQDIINEQNRLNKENKALEINYSKIKNQLTVLEEEKKPYDLKVNKISPAEERVIKTLTIYKASNREIAERLNIAESTVKLHLYNIYNKIGVDNRFAIIDLCKYNYT